MLFTITVFFSLSIFADPESCDLSADLTGQNVVNILAGESIEASCAEFERQNKCKEEPLDEQKLNPESLASALIYRENKRSRDPRDPKSRNSLISDVFESVSKENPSLKREDFEFKLKEKIKEFVKIRKCEPSFGAVQQSLSYDEDDLSAKAVFNRPQDKLKRVEEMTKIAQSAEFIKKSEIIRKTKNKEFFDDFLSSSISADDKEVKVGYCRQEKLTNANSRTQFPHPKCYSSVSKYFLDNKANLGELSEDEIIKDQQELQNCIKENEKAGYRISKVTINSSANQLRNTSTKDEILSGKGFCGFDFQGLSEARAKYTKNELLPKLITSTDLDKLQIDLNSRGNNKNGTSGPCPYDFEGKIKSEYLGIGKKSLDDYKKTEIVVEFEPTQQNQSSPSQIKGIVRITSPCSFIKIKCMGEL